VDVFFETRCIFIEVKLLPVSENGVRPYWNSISGFDFYVVIGISFCIFLPNFPVIGRSGGDVMTSYRYFKTAAIESEIYFQVQV